MLFNIDTLKFRKKEIIKNLIKKYSLIKDILFHLFPEPCYHCTKLCTETLCKKCHNSIKTTLVETIDHKNIKKSAYLYNYSNQIKTLLWELKFNQNKKTASLLSNKLKSSINKLSFFNDIDIFIPIPIHEKKLKIRGYNQVDLIFKAPLTHLNKYYNEQLLQRKINTTALHKLNKKDRKECLYNAFECNVDLKNKTICIVDDILTTGATIEEASKTLFEKGAKEIYALTLSHTQLDLD